MKKLLFLALSLSILSTSCSTSDDPFVEVPQAPKLDNGLIILNEGGFQHNNASVGFSSFSYDEYIKDVAKVSAEPLGDVAQSMAFKDNKAYVVLNGSNKIEIFHRYTFKHEGTITEGLHQPRYIAFANNRMYVTNAESKTVSVYDDKNIHINDISFDGPIEQIIAWNTKLYVQKAAYGEGNEIAVVDADFNISTTIKVENGLQGIATLGDFVFAIAGNDEKSHFYKIDAHTDKIVRTYFSTKNTGAKNLRLDNNDLYYTSKNNVYNWKPNDVNIQPNPVLTIPENEFNAFSSFYGFNVINNTVYIADAGDFVEPSTVSVYRQGKKIKSFKAGLLTNNFYANYNK